MAREQQDDLSAYHATRSYYRRPQADPSAPATSQSVRRKDVFDQALDWLKILPRQRIAEDAHLSHEQVRAGLGLVGSALLLLGVFTPIIQMPIVGGINYFQNGRGDGVIVAILAAVSVFLVFTRRFVLLKWTGLVSLALMVFTFVRLQLALSHMRSAIGTQLADNPFKGLGVLAVNAVQLQWGWVILIIGAALVTVAGLADEALLWLLNRERESLPSKAVYRGLVALLAVIVFPSLIAFFVSPFTDGRERTSPSPSVGASVAPPSRVVTEMKKVLSLVVYEKGFREKDIDAGQFLDYITMKVGVQNNGTKPIRAFRGKVVFKDLFGETIYSVRLSDDDGIEPGQKRSDSYTIEYNQFDDAKVRLRNTALSNMKVEWQPMTVLFGDGTKLGESGE